MIFYFSGTGNSEYFARDLAKNQGDSLLCISDEIHRPENSFHYVLKAGEALSFVFPVYAWAPPELVLTFLDHLQIETADGQAPYVYAVCTCGGNAGNAMKVLEKHLSKQKLSLSSAFSALMPDNYIVMLEVESIERQQKKFKEAAQLLIHINQVVKDRQTGVFEVDRGTLPFLKTALVAPLMNRFGRDEKRFYATDACTGCQLCAEVCTARIITANRGEKPVWKGECNLCLSCIHRCPTKAIQYGRGTEKRGRYVHPESR